MTDLERDAQQWLARYREEERPPPEVDAMVRARIQRNSYSQTCALWIGAVTAAAVLLIVWVLVPRASLLRSGGVTSFAARHTGISKGARTLKERSVQAPRPVPAFDTVASSAARPYALLEARRHIDAGDHDAALELLSPCPQKIGTDALLEDCQLLVIEAMCRSGDLREGRQMIAFFRAGRPDSTYTKKLSEFCLE